MGIKESLKDLSLAFGGSGEATNLGGLIEEIAVAKNPLAALKVDTAIAADEDLLGKVIGDLQSGVSIRDGVIYGTVNYLDDYTGFSGDVSLQSGFYVAIHASVPDQTGVTISVSKNGGEPKNLDADGILVLRFTNPKIDKITFTASKTAMTSFSRTYSLRGITCKK